MPRVEAAFFDFDGVILESVAVKTEAFRRLFQDRSPEEVDEVVAFHLANLGLSRYVKFEHFYANVFREPLSEEHVAELDTHFSRLVEEGVLGASPVAGALDFLRRRCPPLPPSLHAARAGASATAHTSPRRRR